MRFGITRLTSTRAILLGVCLTGMVAVPFAERAPGAVAATRSSQADDAQGCPAGDVCVWQYAGYAGIKEADPVTPACKNFAQKSTAIDNNSPDKVQVFVGADCRSAGATVAPGAHGTMNTSQSPTGDSDISFVSSFRKK